MPLRFLMRDISFSPGKQKILGPPQYGDAILVFGEEFLRFRKREPAEALMLKRNFNDGLFGFGQIQDHYLEYLVFFGTEGEPFVRLEVGLKLQLVLAKAGLLADLAESRLKAPLGMFHFPLGEIPVAMAMVKQEVFDPLIRSSENNYARGNNFSHI